MGSTDCVGGPAVIILSFSCLLLGDGLIERMLRTDIFETSGACDTAAVGCKGGGMDHL